MLITLESLLIAYEATASFCIKPRFHIFIVADKFMKPDSCVILLSKIVFESRQSKYHDMPDDIVLWTRL